MMNTQSSKTGCSKIIRITLIIEISGSDNLGMRGGVWK